MTLVERSR